jgi:hypothetical protein
MGTGSQGCRIPQMCEILQLRQRTIKVYLAGLYRKFNLGRNDEVYQPMIQLAVQLHERRAELGVRCPACGEVEELKLDPWARNQRASCTRRVPQLGDSSDSDELGDSYNQQVACSQ